jgi:hypothetical protein
MSINGTFLTNVSLIDMISSRYVCRSPKAGSFDTLAMCTAVTVMGCRVKHMHAKKSADARVVVWNVGNIGILILFIAVRLLFSPIPSPASEMYYTIPSTRKLPNLSGND